MRFPPAGDGRAQADPANQERAESAKLTEQVKLLVKTEQRLYRSQNELDYQLTRIRALGTFSLATSIADDPGTILDRGVKLIAESFLVDVVAAR